MGEIGEPAKPFLIAALNNQDPKIRIAGLIALSVDLEGRAKDALPSVLPRVTDADPEVRRLAIYFVARVCTDKKKTMDVLLTALTDKDKDVRCVAMRELEALKAENQRPVGN
jgi:HEAT repeat protein